MPMSGLRTEQSDAEYLMHEAVFRAAVNQLLKERGPKNSPTHIRFRSDFDFSRTPEPQIRSNIPGRY